MRHDKEFEGSTPHAGGGESPEDDTRAHDQHVTSLYEKHNAALIRFLSSRLHSEQEAREIAQEAYVKLLGLDEPEVVNHYRAYLFRVAGNLAADRLKQRGRRAELRKVAFAGLDKSSPSPENAVQAAQELAAVHEAIQELPPKCRTAFLLNRVHQLPLQQTAQRMELSVSMVRVYVARALAHCAERLEPAVPRMKPIHSQTQRSSHDPQA